MAAPAQAADRHSAGTVTASAAPGGQLTATVTDKPRYYTDEQLAELYARGFDDDEVVLGRPGPKPHGGPLSPAEPATGTPPVVHHRVLRDHRRGLADPDRVVQVRRLRVEPRRAGMPARLPGGSRARPARPQSHAAALVTGSLREPAEVEDGSMPIELRLVAADVLGIHIPDAGRLFAVAVTVHIAAGLTAVASAILAATARKRAGRHPRAGRVYFAALAVVAATAVVLVAIRPTPTNGTLLGIATVAFTAGSVGYLARHRRWRGWPVWHAFGMAGSFIALLTGFYVDLGPQLPIWRNLPHAAYWILPAAVGIPLTLRALARFRAGDRRAPGTGH
ncbi:hypothetical protein R8Z50_21770 [Longispora sp. K20-0274]|uniref:hypothetical protein n=1 Tax=Longispora sp. K20-0274 TaxID=3088255 RepID=UPI00399B9EE0